MSTPGCSRRKSFRRGTSHSAAKDAVVVTVSIPGRAPRRPATSRSRRSTSAQVLYSVWPSSVRRSSRWLRRNSATPSCSSRVWIWRLTADWVTNSSAAALVKERLRAAASKPFSRSSEGRSLAPLSIRFSHAKDSEISFEDRGDLGDSCMREAHYERNRDEPQENLKIEPGCRLRNRIERAAPCRVARGGRVSGAGGLRPAPPAGKVSRAPGADFHDERQADGFRRGGRTLCLRDDG